MSRPSILDHSQYTLQVQIQDTTTGKIFDLSGMVESVTWQTYRIASQPGSCEVILKEGLRTSDIIVHPGSWLRFGVNGKDYFYGNIEPTELLVDALTGTVYRLKAYDAKKLLASAESRYRREGMTASEFYDETMAWFNTRIMAMGDVGLRWAVREPSVARLQPKNYVVQTLYNQFRDTMRDTHIAERGDANYMIRDNLGVLEWRNIAALRKNIVLGDGSFAAGYTYGDTLTGSFNVIKVVRDNEELAVRDTWIKYDSANVRRWRHRQRTIEAEQHLTDAEIEDMINLHLESNNRTHKTLRMSAIGINGLQAGDGVQLRAGRGRIDAAHWFESVSHAYSVDRHMMDLEVFI